MSGPDGHNPLRWKCDERGCFNELQRPKIECFAIDLPGKIAFSDVDAVTEIQGNALVLEWKATNMLIPTGQRIMWERLTRTGFISVLCIAGNACTMSCTHTARFFRGKWFDWVAATIDDVHSSIRGWADWAKKNPRIG